LGTACPNPPGARPRAEGLAEGQARLLLRILEKRFKGAPAELREAILALQDADRLAALADLAFAVRSLRRFREQAGV
jgi:hypothetical protein